MSIEDVNDVVDREFACDHDDHRLVVTIAANGRRMFSRQCLRCGQRVTAWLGYADLDPDEMENAPLIDESLRDGWRRRRTERWSELYRSARDDEDGNWWRRYNEYLRSPKWQLKSHLVITRDKVCQACLARPAVQAHHLTYKNAFDEPLFDLKGVCARCHEKLHQRRAS